VVRAFEADEKVLKHKGDDEDVAFQTVWSFSTVPTWSYAKKTCWSFPPPPPCRVVHSFCLMLYTVRLVLFSLYWSGFIPQRTREVLLQYRAQ
jgi:hypothetical protein